MPSKVWLLNRSLYGSRQGARRWQQKFEKSIAEFGLHPTMTDPANQCYLNFGLC
ncbi:hypothetical protein CROQUDRAFT_100519 [Cronartium quercuum f. sp. fusiforme G11]|uniref:Uncharacterized protein n=1 Tax=Cronartium quercuum f. sp. fusiforme G11 TaxID=708437 RepID=A0A9P6N656_9BASI|nr:hypothetical protein CROQUDRAFT_100519 [Cronartium quercuum f. sp. fusiforme G11]